MMLKLLVLKSINNFFINSPNKFSTYGFLLVGIN